MNVGKGTGIKIFAHEHIEPKAALRRASLLLYQSLHAGIHKPYNEKDSM